MVDINTDCTISMNRNTRGIGSNLKYCGLSILMHGMLLHFQPLQATTEAPTEFWWIIPHVDLPVDADNVETEGFVPMSHGDTCDGHNRDCVTLTDDPCSGGYWSSLGNNFRWEPVEEIRISKISRGTLIRLCVVELDPPGFVEHLVGNWRSAAGGTNLAIWKCAPA